MEILDLSEIVSYCGEVQLQTWAFILEKYSHKTFHPCLVVGDLKHVKSHYLLIVVLLFGISQELWIVQNAKLQLNLLQKKG